jgi:small-conductance mechanosensitive channel
MTLPGIPALSDNLLLGLVVVIGYPILVLAMLEAARSFGRSRELTASLLYQIAYLLLPTGAIWLTLRVLADLPDENWAVRTAETAFALTGLYLLLRLAQAALMTLVDDQARAPKLMLDILRIGLSLIWGAVAVSNIWHVDLGSLFAAMGVGSIVLGFALQEFLGNLLSGLGLLSAHKFGIGDWIMIDGAPARVVEMDWRTVTLIKDNGNRVVVANSTLAKGNLVIAARASENSGVAIPLAFGLDIPPEKVRDAVLEAGKSLPSDLITGEVTCLVTGIAANMIHYLAILPVDNPGILAGPRNEFLSRFWYVAQRHGLRLGAPDVAPLINTEDTMEARLRMLTASGAFPGNADILSLLARSSSFRRYRRADIPQRLGKTFIEALFVVSGELFVSIPKSDDEIRIETVGPGQLLVLHETLANAASPVQVTAGRDTDLLAIPTAALRDAMERSPSIARDVAALAESRRLAIQPLTRTLRAVG